MIAGSKSGAKVSAVSDTDQYCAKRFYLFHLLSGYLFRVFRIGQCKLALALLAGDCFAVRVDRWPRHGQWLTMQSTQRRPSRRVKDLTSLYPQIACKSQFLLFHICTLKNIYFITGIQIYNIKFKSLL